MFEEDIAKKETAPATDKLCDKTIQMKQTIREKDESIEELQRQLNAQNRVKLMNCKISVERKAILDAMSVSIKRTDDVIHNVAGVGDIKRDVLCFAHADGAYYVVR